MVTIITEVYILIQVLLPLISIQSHKNVRKQELLCSWSGKVLKLDECWCVKVIPIVFYTFYVVFHQGDFMKKKIDVGLPSDVCVPFSFKLDLIIVISERCRLTPLRIILDNSQSHRITRQKVKLYFHAKCPVVFVTFKILVHWLGFVKFTSIPLCTITCKKDCLTCVVIKIIPLVLACILRFVN